MLAKVSRAQTAGDSTSKTLAFQSQDSLNSSAVVQLDSAILYTDTIIQWYDIETAMELQKKVPKKIFMSIYANWCRWCKLMRDSVYTNHEIAHYINSNFYPVRFNGEEKNTVRFKGREYKFIDEEKLYVNELTLFLLNHRQSYPAFVFFNEEGNVIHVRTSTMDIALAEVLLNYYGSNAYLTMPFNEFDESFEGKIDHE